MRWIKRRNATITRVIRHSRLSIVEHTFTNTSVRRGVAY